MKFMQIGMSAMLALSLAACGTSAVIKKVEDRPVESLRANENSKPIQFKKIVVKLKRGEHVGAIQTGLLCVPQGDLNWKGGRISIDSEEFTEVFKDELEKFAFKTVGDPDALFDDPSTWKSEILVAGLIKELKTNVCYPLAGFGNFSSSKGEAFLKVDWQIYSKLDRSVVHTVTTEGAAKSDDAISGGNTVAVLNAFAQASRNLLADSKFRDIVSRGGETVKSTDYASSSKIAMLPGASKPLGSSPNEWASGMVTIFAGNGHGSGFVISEDLILTNYHVVGQASSTTIKLSNGAQVIGKVIASNAGQDVAIVKLNVKMPKHFKVARSMPEVGSDVYAIGSPLDEKLQASITRGVISGVREENKRTLIQSDVNIRPGSSGGPLVDKKGAVLGIATSALMVNGQAQGINFFIPIDDALKTLGVN